MLPPTIEARAPVNGVGRETSSVQDDASGRRVITESSGSGWSPLNPPTTTKACGISLTKVPAVCHLWPSGDDDED